MNIDLTQIRTAGDKDGETLSSAQQSARHTMLVALSKAADAITGPVPQAERDSWATKESAARDWVAGTASPHQIAMLDAECGITGETKDELSANINTKADAFTSFASTMSGLRRNTTTAIDLATTPDEAQSAIELLLEFLSPT